MLSLSELYGSKMVEDDAGTSIRKTKQKTTKSPPPLESREHICPHQAALVGSAGVGLDGQIHQPIRVVHRDKLKEAVQLHARQGLAVKRGLV